MHTQKLRESSVVHQLHRSSCLADGVPVQFACYTSVYLNADTLYRHPQAREFMLLLAETFRHRLSRLEPWDLHCAPMLSGYFVLHAL